MPETTSAAFAGAKLIGMKTIAGALAAAVSANIGDKNWRPIAQPFLVSALAFVRDLNTCRHGI